MSHGAELQPRLFSLAAAKLPPKALSPPAPSCPHARSSEEPLLPSAHDLIFHPKRPFLGLTFTCGLLGPLQPPAAGLGSCWPRGQRHPLVARRAEGAPCPAAMGSCVAKNPRLTGGVGLSGRGWHRWGWVGMGWDGLTWLYVIWDGWGGLGRVGVGWLVGRGWDGTYWGGLVYVGMGWDGLARFGMWWRGWGGMGQAEMGWHGLGWVSIVWVGWDGWDGLA